MSDTLRWRAAPFHALCSRQGNRLVSSPLSGERRVIPEGEFALLDQLRAFRTLPEHAENAVRRMGNDQGRNADIKRTLDNFRQQGLLISVAEFFRAASPKNASGAEPISTIAIPTSGRTKLVERCMDSYAAHAQKFGHQVRFAIAGAEVNSVAHLQSRYSITHIDRQRIEEWETAMSAAGIDPAIVRFALLGQTSGGEAPGLPAGIARTTGANRNALLLECAGEPFLSVDDDTLCSLARSPSWRSGMTIHSTGTPLEIWFGPQLPSHSEAADLDLLAELGRSLGPAIRTSVPLSPAEFDHSTLERLCRGDARASLAQVGLMGDAATDSPSGWLTAIGPTRVRLVSTEEGYRAALGSRRIVAVAPCETVSASRQLMAYCCALDNREELPPFPPLGRDQDGVFACWERIVQPDGFTVHVPFAVAHEPAEVRTFPPGETRPPQGMALNDVLHLLCEDLEPVPARVTRPERMRWLGSRLEDIAGLSRAGFEALLVERRLRMLSRRIVFHESALKLFGSKPSWWVQDIQRFVRSWEEEMTGPDILRFAEIGANAPPNVLEDPLCTYQNYVRWCGSLLRNWSAICEVAKGLRIK